MSELFERIVNKQLAEKRGGDLIERLKEMADEDGVVDMGTVDEREAKRMMEEWRQHELALQQAKRLELPHPWSCVAYVLSGLDMDKAWEIADAAIQDNDSLVADLAQLVDRKVEISRMSDVEYKLVVCLGDNKTRFITLYDE